MEAAAKMSFIPLCVLYLLSLNSPVTVLELRSSRTVMEQMLALWLELHVSKQL